MRTAALALALLLCAGQAQAADSPAGTASQLPFNMPGFERETPPPIYREFQTEKTVQDSTCAVSTDQLPPDFLKLMGRLNEPVESTTTGLPPVVDDVVPALRNAPAQQERRRSHGVEVLHGNGNALPQRSQENGVTVYRGLEREKR